MPDILARDMMIKDIHTIAGNSKVAYARLIMLRHNIGALPVVDDNEVVVEMARDSDLCHQSHPSA
jgi:CBS-domain-containing membrane protein